MKILKIRLKNPKTLLSLGEFSHFISAQSNWVLVIFPEPPNYSNPTSIRHQRLYVLYIGLILVAK